MKMLRGITPGKHDGVEHLIDDPGVKSQEEIRAVVVIIRDDLKYAIEVTGISGCFFTELALSE